MSFFVYLRGVPAGLCVSTVVTLGSPTPTFAQSPAPAVTPQDPQAAAPKQTTDEELERLRRLTEPDFTLVNLPSTALLPRRGGNFRLTHRFLANLAEGSFTDHLENLFGLDNGAVIALEFRYAVISNLQAIVHRSSLEKTIMFAGQYDAIKQGPQWWSLGISGIASIEGTDNFRGRDVVVDDGHDHEHPEGSGGHRAPALGAVFSKRVSDRMALYAVPVWVHHAAITLEGPRDTGYLGLGGRLRLTPRLYVVGEVSPRIGGFAPGIQEFAFGFEGRAGGHLFQLTFTNAVGTTIGQISQGGFADTLYLGFNLSRKFF
jgi:Membrane bound beta barrel domain (DUF5777)